MNVNELTATQLADWTRWVCRNSLRGIKELELLSVMLDKGLSHALASKLILDVKSHPIFEGALPVSWRVKNLEALLNVRLALANQRGERHLVDRCSSLSANVFHRDFYVANKPVVVEGMLHQWPALGKWTPEYFRERLGEVPVEIQSSRKSSPVYEVFLKGHSKSVRLGQFVDMVLSGGETNEYYLTANDRFLERDGAAVLKDDYWAPSQYMHSDDREGKEFLWFGPQGAVSPLHRDRLNVLMTQVYGRKIVKLIPSLALHLVYNHESFFSEVDCENPDFERFPLFAGAPVMEAEIGPGDALLIPVGWWHHIRSLDISISLSFTNFLFPNDFEDLFRHQIEQ